jgi:hypothetical protein
VTLLAGLAGVAAFVALEAASWWWEGRDLAPGAGDARPVGPRVRAVATVVAASLIVTGLLAGAPSADPSRVSVAVGVAAVSALLLGGGAVVRAARR